MTSRTMLSDATKCTWNRNVAIPTAKAMQASRQAVWRSPRPRAKLPTANHIPTAAVTNATTKAMMVPALPLVSTVGVRFGLVHGLTSEKYTGLPCQDAVSTCKGRSLPGHLPSQAERESAAARESHLGEAGCSCAGSIPAAANNALQSALLVVVE